MHRRSDLDRFYEILIELERGDNGRRRLGECHGKLGWPSQGVYFFFEPNEMREDDRTPRVVRVGTHALTDTSKTTLWHRLAQHRGTASNAGGNHRGSIFRLLVGEATMRRSPDHAVASWGQGSSAPAGVRTAERPAEKAVSDLLEKMDVLVLPVKGRQDRSFVERNSIALLSNFQRPSIDDPSELWLGRHSGREKVRRSGLWNNQLVEKEPDDDLLSRLSVLVSRRGDPVDGPTTSLTWKRNGSICPICAGRGRESPSYPGALCRSCVEDLVDDQGQPVDMWNTNPLGSGIAVKTSGGTFEDSDVPIFARGIACWAREVRWGGVAVQPVEVWLTAYPAAPDEAS